MAKKSLNQNFDENINENLPRFTQSLKNSQANVLKQGNSLTRRERESLFNQAEDAWLEGHKDDSVDLYMRCLLNLEVKTAFPSLPRCLRALANNFLEKKQYVKAIHFVQAERLYYESALMDAATLQQRLIDISSGKVSANETIESPIIEIQRHRIEKSKKRLREYKHLIEYFRETNNLELALEYAQKSVTLNIEVYGEESDEARKCECVFQDLSLAVDRNNTTFFKIGDVKNRTQDSEDETAVIPYQSYLGFSSSEPVRDVSKMSDSSSSLPSYAAKTTAPNAINTISKIIFRFLLTSAIFIMASTAFMLILYQIVLSFHSLLFSEPQSSVKHSDNIMGYEHIIRFLKRFLLEPFERLLGDFVYIIQWIGGKLGSHLIS